MPEFDNTQAEKEGWSIFACDASANGDFQLQKCDEMDVFTSDPQAWKFVSDKAAERSPYHLMALLFLMTHNPAELLAIRKLYPESVA